MLHHILTTHTRLGGAAPLGKPLYKRERVSAGNDHLQVARTAPELSDGACLRVLFPVLLLVNCARSSSESLLKPAPTHPAHNKGIEPDSLAQNTAKRGRRHTRVERARRVSNFERGRHARTAGVHV